MPPPPIPDETLHAALEAVRRHPTHNEAAASLGIPLRTLQNHLREHQRRNFTGGSRVPLSQDESKPQTATRAEIIDEILRVVNQDTTKVVTRNKFRNESRYAESAWSMHFGTWEEAKRQAGVTLSRHAHRLEKSIAKHASVDKMRALGTEKRGWEDRYLRPAGRRWQTAVVCGDLHDRTCDPFYRRVLVDTIRRAQPEKVIINGDLYDLPEFSKHAQDPREFDLLARIRWVLDFIRDVREAAPDAEVTIIEGNHEYRLLRHLSEESPAMRVVLADLHGFTVPKLLGLDTQEVNFVARADLGAFTERDIKTQIGKNYLTCWDSILLGHFPEMRSMGMPGASGHHHKHIVWPSYSPTYGPHEWHQIGCGHQREAVYCNGERWGNGFLLAHVDTWQKRTQFEYLDVSHQAAFVGGRLYERTAGEPVLDILPGR